MTRILLVEDNEMNRDMLTRRLERKGFTIESAGDGEEALKKIKTHQQGRFLFTADDSVSSSNFVHDSSYKYFLFKELEKKEKTSIGEMKTAVKKKIKELEKLKIQLEKK